MTTNNLQGFKNADIISFNFYMRLICIYEKEPGFSFHLSVNKRYVVMIRLISNLEHNKPESNMPFGFRLLAPLQNMDMNYARIFLMVT